MQRRGQPVLDHFRRIEIGESGMQGFELAEILENAFHELIHGLVPERWPTDERGQHAIGFGSLRIVLVHTGGNGRLWRNRACRHQLVDDRPGDGHQLCAATRRGVLDVGCRMADAVKKAVDLVVAQGGAVLVGLEFGGQREILQGPAQRAISYSSEARVPEPGLPTLKRLPFTSSNW